RDPSALCARGPRETSTRRRRQRGTRSSRGGCRSRSSRDGSSPPASRGGFAGALRVASFLLDRNLRERAPAPTDRLPATPRACGACRGGQEARSRETPRRERCRVAFRQSLPLRAVAQAAGGSSIGWRAALSGGYLPCGARHLWLPRRESSPARARRCRRRTTRTSDVSERSVRTRHGASLSLAEAPSESRRPCSVLVREAAS